MEIDINSLVVHDNEAGKRYEIAVGDQVAVLTYTRRVEGRIAFVHTLVPEALEGHGLAAKLTRFALDDAQAKGLAVIPLCPYVVSFIRRHREYADLVPPEEQGRLAARQ